MAKRRRFTPEFKAEVVLEALSVGTTVHRVGIKPTFYYFLLKRTHNLGLDSAPNFRWRNIKKPQLSMFRSRSQRFPFYNIYLGPTHVSPAI